MPYRLTIYKPEFHATPKPRISEVYISHGVYRTLGMLAANLGDHVDTLAKGYVIRITEEREE